MEFYLRQAGVWHGTVGRERPKKSAQAPLRRLDAARGCAAWPRLDASESTHQFAHETREGQARRTSTGAGATGHRATHRSRRVPPRTRRVATEAGFSGASFSVLVVAPERPAVCSHGGGACLPCLACMPCALCACRALLRCTATPPLGQAESAGRQRRLAFEALPASTRQRGGARRGRAVAAQSFERTPRNCMPAALQPARAQEAIRRSAWRWFRQLLLAGLASPGRRPHHCGRWRSRPRLTPATRGSSRRIGAAQPQGVRSRRASAADALRPEESAPVGGTAKPLQKTLTIADDGHRRDCHGQ